MRCLTVRQPWAWAILHGGKDVENREWYTSFRGTIAIHAASTFGMPKDDFADYLGDLYGEPWKSMAERFGEIKGPNDIRGRIIGTVEVYDCVSDRKCDSPWKADGYEFFCWLLRNPQPLEVPIPAKGQLGFWNAPDEWFEAGYVPEEPAEVNKELEHMRRVRDFVRAGQAPARDGGLFTDLEKSLDRGRE